ncbi:hypothetical protein SY88_20500 [Clostridiales bacterium PH28_bin88]|nr:hypothetical protein SY88_20500 [Clostridiales bacterium PH28_bin88]
MDYAEVKFVIQSLVKGLTVLECFASDLDEYGVTELSALVNIPESTVQRIINTLEFKGYILQNPLTQKYRLSLKLLTTKATFQRMNFWLQKSRKHMVALNEQCGETVNLAIRDEDKLVFIDKVDSGHLLRPNYIVGARYPLHCTALGKCLVSDFPEDKLKYLFADKMEQLTPYTNTELSGLIQDLKFVRENGYGIDDQQFQLGLYCIGVPIYGFGGRVVAALSVSTPMVRVNNDNEGNIIKWAKETAENISDELQQVFEQRGSSGAHFS